jgi:hypothetical protein
MRAKLPVRNGAENLRIRLGNPVATFLAGLLLLAGAGVAHGQWQDVTYTLKGGWNAIYLHGEATHAPLETLFSGSAAALQVQEVWRWNPGPNRLQFLASPQSPTQGSPDWSVWVRGNVGNTLGGMTGQAAYLVKCAGTSANTYQVVIPQRPMPPNAIWVRQGANLLGFPSRSSAGTFPLFSNYFATFPAAISSNFRIYKYMGGELNANNPFQIFAPTLDRVHRDQAYWFEAEVVGNFYGPLQINLSMPQGMDFGRTRSIMTARLINRTGNAMTVTIAPVPSNLPPAGQEAITGLVPITRRVFDPSTIQWTETRILTSYTETIPALGSLEVHFGIDRSAMVNSAGDYFASLLRFTDSSNLSDILIPVQARTTSLAGLWIGEAQVTAIESKAQEDEVTPTGQPFQLRYLLHVADDGTASILSQAFLGRLAPPPHLLGICTRESGLKLEDKAAAMRIVAVHMPLDRVIDGSGGTGSGSVSVPGSLTRIIHVPFDDPTNPFVHQYHPDHDNRDAQGNPLPAGVESYDIKRVATFTFTSAPPSGSAVTTGWGSTVIGGLYAEVISGLHQDSAGVGSGNGLELAGTFELRRVSEIGTLTVNP